MINPSKIVVHQIMRKAQGDQVSIERLFQTVRDNIPGAAIEIKHSIVPYASHGFWNRIMNMLAVRRLKGDLFHVTGDINYVTLGLPWRRVILTIHDLDRLERLSGIKKSVLDWFWFRLPLKHCGFITTISDTTAQELISRYPWCRSKITVLHNTVPQLQKPNSRAFNEKAPIVLAIGCKPNKNLERLVEAVHGTPCQLRIIGKLSDSQIAHLERYEVKYSNDFRLSDEELAQEYAASDIVAVVSTKEGFGMPIIEGQQANRVVMTSNISCLPEVAGEGACYVDPYSVPSIRSGLLKIIGDAQYRDRLIRLGSANCQRFSPQSVGKAYQQYYLDCAKE